MSTFLGMETMRRAVAANQTALQTVGNNIANAGTPGYSRQRVNMHATPGYPGSGPFGQPIMEGRVGTGVGIDRIQRVRDQFLDQQFRLEAHVSGYTGVQSRTFSRLEDLFNEAPHNEGDLGGLSSQLNGFFNGWREIAAGQDSQAVLIEQSEAVMDTFDSLEKAFQSEIRLLEQEQDITETKINDLLAQVADNNAAIKKIEESGQAANELYDQQDLLIDELATLIPIEVSRSSSQKGHEGSYDIKLLNSDVVLVDGQASADSFSPFTFSVENQNGEPALIVNGEPYSDVISGKFLGIDASIANVGKAIETMQDLRGQLIEDVNGILPNFFDEASQRVSTDFIENPNLLNVNKETAQRIANLSQENDSVTKQYQQFMSELGVETQSVQRKAEAAQARLRNIDGNRMSISGVSLDEELTMLVQFQHSYNAAARVMTAMDEMLNTVINGMGVVGR
ncbi:flagellar hook-associated protein FlgK [Alkalihalobacillus sp. LMS6]|uniref:flagellar hook-associated protein FlgK n=1 Tax=Alkalihalobacillus sp. LMS6 TaxID=2924034 RepID=UPI0020D0A6CD|nr:flagellar hook-associated protein FlgK [Alkalihalobacillus sp. LMS6]UTR05609.1 flagellar hook-associated protein FlgK [Alkalihalobacillus sp. LMS6]